MVQNYNDFKKYIKADFRSQNKILDIKSFILDPLVRFTWLLRFNEYLLNSKKPMAIRFFWLLWFKRLSVRLGFSIPLNVFDQGVAIVHYGLLLIHPNCQIGKNCRVHMSVSIGGYSGLAHTYKEGEIKPTIIGDNCYISPGAMIFGGITIGKNSIIAANSVVNKSFENEGVTIGGIPAKILSEKGSENFLFKGAKTD
tara:strand:- start:16964 stop:17554 length:591 start_codon:yes stop_codon:yes gene_type:complete